ncbi:DUF6630 family protein [Microbacterium sp. NPDC055903]
MASEAASVASWESLCRLLDDDEELLDGVRAELERGEDADAWASLFDGLDDSGALAYLESTDTGVELADALAQLPRIFATGIDLDPVGDVEDLEAAIAVAAEMLVAHGLTLVYLEEDPDAHPLVAVPVDRVERILELTAALGGTARAYA